MPGCIQEWVPRERQGWMWLWASQCPVWEVFQLGTSGAIRNVLILSAVLVVLELLIHSPWQRVGSVLV